MRIEIDKLEGRSGNFSEVYQVNELPLEDDGRLLEPASIRGRVRLNGNEVELRGLLDAKIEAQCGRCLQPVALPIHAEFAERFISSVSWRSEQQHELAEDDLNLAVFDGEAIELDDLVREEILLAMPGHVLCREDCKGLCPVCGVDRNVKTCQCQAKEMDSRWRDLEKLRQ